jgi:hypothetical protein
VGVEVVAVGGGPVDEGWRSQRRRKLWIWESLDGVLGGAWGKVRGGILRDGDMVLVKEGHDLSFGFLVVEE